jgi:hypothetical protein
VDFKLDILLYVMGKDNRFTSLVDFNNRLSSDFVEMDTSVAARAKVGHLTYFCLSVVLGFYHCLTKHIWEVYILAPCNFKAGLTPTTPVTSTAIYPVKMSIGHKSPTVICIVKWFFFQGKPVFYTFLLWIWNVSKCLLFIYDKTRERPKGGKLSRELLLLLQVSISTKSEDYLFVMGM